LKQLTANSEQLTALRWCMGEPPFLKIGLNAKAASGDVPVAALETSFV
jgi:hypothetical protein